MLGLRQKLSFGFGGLLVILLFIGIQSILYITRLGGSIDVILRENYRSVVACQDMKEALERMDSGALLVLLGYQKNGEDLIRSNEGAFEGALTVEFNNITVPGEIELATRIKTLYGRYLPIIANVTDPTAPASMRRARYHDELLPLFNSIKGAADDVLKLNQQNMIDMNDRARASAASARREMYALLIAGTAVAVGFLLLARRWILQPINRLIESAGTGAYRRGAGLDRASFCGVRIAMNAVLAGQCVRHQEGGGHTKPSQSTKAPAATAANAAIWRSAPVMEISAAAAPRGSRALRRGRARPPRWRRRGAGRTRRHDPWTRPGSRRRRTRGA